MMGTRISTKDLLSSRSGLAGFVVLWLILVVLASKVWFFITGDIRAVVAAVPDDTCYFYKIAWNVVQGKGLTFDGINPTNGFQPLWLYALLPLAWLMRSASPEDYFRAALVYQALIVLSAGVVLFFALRRVSPLGATLMAVAIFYFLSRSYFTNGMETGVLLLSAALVLLYALRYRVFFENNPKVALGFGGLLGGVAPCAIGHDFRCRHHLSLRVGSYMEFVASGRKSFRNGKGRRVEFGCLDCRHAALFCLQQARFWGVDAYQWYAEKQLPLHSPT